MTEYFYVFIRKDISEVQRIIQVGHACRECPHELGVVPPSMVLFEVPNEQELVRISHNLRFISETMPYRIFWEPDINVMDGKTMGYSSICTGIIKEECRHYFSEYNLYKSEMDDPKTAEFRESLNKS